MHPSPPPPPDLSQLIDQAQTRVNAQKAAAAAAAPGAAAALPWKMGLTTALWLGLCLVWALLLWPRSLAERELAAELEFMLDAARADVRAEIERSGRLPERLPARFYASAVRLEPVDASALPPTFRLTAELGGARASWSSSDVQGQR